MKTGAEYKHEAAKAVAAQVGMTGLVLMWLGSLATVASTFGLFGAGLHLFLSGGALGGLAFAIERKRS